MKILIVTGGSSSERKISLISAKEVKKALLKNGHEVTTFDFRNGFSKLKRVMKKFDVVFPVMHGKEGEDGKLYKFLKSNKKSYVGSDPEGARIAFDKILFKKYCVKNHIPTPEWKILVNTKDIEKFGFPCILKGAYGGSSHEVFILNSKKDLSKVIIKKNLKSNNPFYLERLVQGVEITIGILLGKPLPIIEIIPEKGWFDYKNKYSGKSKEIPFAPSINKVLGNKLQRLVLQVHNDLKLGSYSRMDIIVENNTPYVLEINTPGGVGLTPASLFPKAAQAAGIPFEVLVERINDFFKDSSSTSDLVGVLET